VGFPILSPLRMKWSVPIGRIAGIRVQLHVTFLALLLWIGVSLWNADQDVAVVVNGVGFVLALFLCVLLHEFGHALTARRFGIRTQDITLLPIGGVARLERMPKKPSEELLVAVAGPAVNVVIGALLLIALSVLGRPASLESLAAADAAVGAPNLLERLLVVNIMLVAFNLLPAFPMDGGRVLRALLAMRMPYARATSRAANVGKVFASVFAVVGFFTNPFLMLIAVFVWFGASQESVAAQMTSVLGDVPVSHAMITEFRALASRDTLAHAVELLLAGSQHDFPVVAEGAVVGVLTRQALLAALARQEVQQPVEVVMQRDVPLARLDEPLEEALMRMQASPLRTMPVLNGSTLVGLLTMENVGEYVSVQAALRRND
jgi:Zn-dependent protease/predicted transcriptional regulator